MFGRSKVVEFKPSGYSSRRKAWWRLPRWFLLLLLGAGAGAGGLWYAQERYLPARLSLPESNQLRAALDEALQEKQRLAAELKVNAEKLVSVQKENGKAVSDLAATRQTADRLQKDLAQFVKALPPDPRGGPIGIRAASFSPASGQLSYNIIFSRQRKGDDVFDGMVQLLVTGSRGSGREETIQVKPVPVSIEAYQQLSGTAELPAGLQIREITVRVLRGTAGGEMLSMRVFKVS